MELSLQPPGPKKPLAPRWSHRGSGPKCHHVEVSPYPAMRKITFGLQNAAMTPKFSNRSEKPYFDLDFRNPLSYSYLGAMVRAATGVRLQWRINQQVIDLIAGRSSAW